MVAEANSVSLPRQVEIHLPTSQLRFTLRTERHLINQIVTENQELWMWVKLSNTSLARAMMRA